METRQEGREKDPYRPISFLNVEQMLDTILTNRTQQYTQRIMNRDKVGLLPEMQG